MAISFYKLFDNFFDEGTQYHGYNIKRDEFYSGYFFCAQSMKGYLVKHLPTDTVVEEVVIVPVEVEADFTKGVSLSDLYDYMDLENGA